MFILTTTHEKEMESLKAAHEKEIASLRAIYEIDLSSHRRSKAMALAEIAQIDSALARRPAVAHLDTRYDKICAAFEMAQEADTLLSIAKYEDKLETPAAKYENELERVEQELKFAKNSQPIRMGDHSKKYTQITQLNEERARILEKISRANGQDVPEIAQNER